VSRPQLLLNPFSRPFGPCTFWTSWIGMLWSMGNSMVYRQIWASKEHNTTLVYQFYSLGKAINPHCSLLSSNTMLVTLPVKFHPIWFWTEFDRPGIWLVCSICEFEFLLADFP
jgi:hypothetical protein